MTRWADDVHPNQTTEYPRPELSRGADSWTSLNGLWEVDASVASIDSPPFGHTLSGHILVPYPIESPLSGIRNLTASGYMFYRRVLEPGSISCPARTLLHFEAVDWQAKIWCNGDLLGSHSGGYDPFTFELTACFAAAKGNPTELIVGVFDPTDDSEYGIPVGKQNLAAFHDKAPGNRYVPTSGIWQTVWAECVGEAHLSAVTPVPSVTLPAGSGSGPTASVTFEIEVTADRERPLSVQLLVTDAEGDAFNATCAVGGAAKCSVQLDEPLLWCSRESRTRNLLIARAPSLPIGRLTLRISLQPATRRLNRSSRVRTPQLPAVYTFTASLVDATDAGGSPLDHVTGSFVVRHVAVGLDARGVARPMLNGEIVYVLATLDQVGRSKCASVAPPRRSDQRATVAGVLA